MTMRIVNGRRRTGERMEASCDVCGRPVFKNGHFIKVCENLEVWCHRCYTDYPPSEDNYFDPDNEEWEILP